MIHAREDYNERIQDSAGLIPADEPVFIVRGQDAVGFLAVRAWAHLHRVNGGSDPAYEAAMKHAKLMEDWPKKKLADMPPKPHSSIIDDVDTIDAIIAEVEKPAKRGRKKKVAP